MTSAVAHTRTFMWTQPTGLPNEGFFRFCHDHPTLAKVIEIATLISGGIVFDLGLTLGSWVFCLIGGAACLTSIIALIALQILAPSHHDMTEHVFSPSRCEGGELYYDGDLPILSIDGRDPKRAGFAQGYLLGDAIHQISSRFDTALHTFLRRPRAEELEDFLYEVKQTIPAPYLAEMEGLVEGYNRWVCEQNGFFRPKEMTLNEALLFHLMPDSHNLLIGGPFADLLLPKESIGCTSLLDIHPEKGIIFGRNMDWPSLDLVGKYSFIKHVDRGDLQTVEISVPGMIGTLTGMNEHGFSLAMNVCPGEKSNDVRGMPALFYNRYCLEHCQTVADMDGIEERPLCAYHLIIADPENGQSHHFYQGLERLRLRRILQVEALPLVTLNQALLSHIDQNHSRLRGEILNGFYEELSDFDLDREELMETAIQLPGINNFKTTHTVIMRPRDRLMKVSFDNSFSADNPLLEVPTDRLFRQRDFGILAI